MVSRSSIALSLMWLAVLASPGVAQDAGWPRWRGPTGDGAWEPKDLPANLSQTTPKQLWSTQVGGGYSGVTAADGRVFLMDLDTQASDSPKERVLCFDAKTGQQIWNHSWSVDYGKMEYGDGPRSSVTVDGARCYALGARGQITCLAVADGKRLWAADAVSDFGAKPPQWGFAASPLIDGDHVLLHVGAANSGSVIALDKTTGKEVWRGGPDPAGYCTPEIIQHAGARQLIAWGPAHVQSIDAASGRTLWTYPYKITYGVSIAQPLYRDRLLLVSGYWHGTKVLKLGKTPDEVSLLWENEKEMCGLMSAPLYKDGTVFLLDKNHGLQALRLETGELLWRDENTLTPAGRNPQMSLVWMRQSEGLAALLNASGELVYVRLSDTGAEELVRHQVIGKTWSHPAFVGPTLFARSNTELVAWQLW